MEKRTIGWIAGVVVASVLICGGLLGSNMSWKYRQTLYGGANPIASPASGSFCDDLYPGPATPCTSDSDCTGIGTGSCQPGAFFGLTVVALPVLKTDPQTMECVAGTCLFDPDFEDPAFTPTHLQQSCSSRRDCYTAFDKMLEIEQTSGVMPSKTLYFNVQDGLSEYSPPAPQNFNLRGPEPPGNIKMVRVGKLDNGFLVQMPIIAYCEDGTTNCRCPAGSPPCTAPGVPGPPHEGFGEFGCGGIGAATCTDDNRKFCDDGTTLCSSNPTVCTGIGTGQCLAANDPFLHRAVWTFAGAESEGLNLLLSVESPQTLSFIALPQNLVARTASELISEINSQAPGCLQGMGYYSNGGGVIKYLPPAGSDFPLLARGAAFLGLPLASGQRPQGPIVSALFQPGFWYECEGTSTPCFGNDNPPVPNEDLDRDCVSSGGPIGTGKCVQVVVGRCEDAATECFRDGADPFNDPSSATCAGIGSGICEPCLTQPRVY